MPQTDDTMMGRLKSATDDLHRTAEGRDLQRALVKGTLGRDTYAAYLGQMLLVHQALESAIDASIDRHPALRAVVRDYHRREPDLRADLAFFGTGEGEPVNATRRLLASIDRFAESSPVGLLGVLYVLEGSTNGAKYIAMSLMRTWGLQPGPGLAYLDPHGDQQKPRWQAFKDDMNGAGLTEAEQAELIDSARQTFQAVADISDEVNELVAA